MKKIFILLSVSILFISNTFAAQIPNTTGAVSSATGGAGVSVVDVNDSAFLNPAVIPLYPRKQLSFSYSSERFAVSMVDNGSDALFPAGLGYEKYSNDAFKSNVYHLILAYAFETKTGNISFGADVNLNDMKLTGSDTSYKQTRATAGFLWQPTKALSFGLTQKNIALNDTDLPDAVDHVAITTAGLAYVYQNFAQLRFDMESIEKQPSDRYIYKFGLETYINDWIITRFGYRNDNVLSQNFTTLGVGFAGPQFQLHYAYQSEAKSTVDPLHIIDLSVPF
jgi:hypothetical protein